MTYTIGFKTRFAFEFDNLMPDQKKKIGEFRETYMQHGLQDDRKYPGKLSPSWLPLPINDPDHIYTKSNSMWHYHIGLPNYTQSKSHYKTSDWVLHFQWFDGTNHIDLVDFYTHYKSSGAFYLPPSTYLI